MVKIVFSLHAKLQLIERKISEREVLEAIRKPDRIVRQLNGRFQTLKISKRKGKEYLLVIIYDETLAVQEIVTAFYTSRIKKYL